MVWENSHTDDWRQLNWSVGGDWAAWFCRWCDAQENPQEAMEALLTVAAMTWARVVEVSARHGCPEREALIAFVERS